MHFLIGKWLLLFLWLLCFDQGRLREGWLLGHKKQLDFGFEIVVELGWIVIVIGQFEGLIRG